MPQAEGLFLYWSLELKHVLFGLGVIIALQGVARTYATDRVVARGKPVTYPALLRVDDRSKIAPVPRDKVICFALYTVQNRVLKLSAHLYPLATSEPHAVTLEVQRDGQWRQVAHAKVFRMTMMLASPTFGVVGAGIRQAKH